MREKKELLGHGNREEVPGQREQSLQKPWDEKEHCVVEESFVGNDLGEP